MLKIKKVPFQFLVILLPSIIALSLQGQNIQEARAIVDTLSSPYFHGRGYVAGGDSLAASFLLNQFKKIGLKPFTEHYLQSFHFPVNTFPGKVSLKIDGQELITGRDFILQPDCKGVKGKFKLFALDTSVFSSHSAPKSPQKKRKTAIVLPADWQKKENKVSEEVKKEVEEFPVVVKLIDKKLTFSVATGESEKSTIQLLSSKCSSKSKKLKLDIDSRFLPSHLAKNVIGYIEGSTKKDSFLIISAHYDHLGHLGKDTYFPGANDNASGIATMLELAKFYTKPENRLPYSIVFIAFAGEEAGLIGSKYFVEHPLLALNKIKFLINLDLLGSGKDGITVVNGKVFTQQYMTIDSLNNVNQWFPKIVARGKAANSDHYFFSEKGVPSFFIYTLGEITAYHDIDDKAEVVTFSKFYEVFGLITAFLKKQGD